MNSFRLLVKCFYIDDLKSAKGGHFGQNYVRKFKTDKNMPKKSSASEAFDFKF